MYRLLIDEVDSPYRTFSDTKRVQVSLDEFLWATSIVGTRNLVMNNQPY